MKNHLISLAALILVAAAPLARGQGVDELNKRGKTRLNQGDWDGAILDFTQVIQLSPQLADAYCNRGT